PADRPRARRRLESRGRRHPLPRPAPRQCRHRPPARRVRPATVRRRAAGRAGDRVSNHPGAVAVIREALDAHARATTRVFDERAQSVGASECGQCARKVFWLKNEGDPVHGAPRDRDYVDAWCSSTRVSSYAPQFCEPALRAHYGRVLLFAGADQRTLVSEFLSATPDALLINQPRDALAHLGVPDIGADRSLVVECKTAD